jgi:hypothetical protein
MSGINVFKSKIAQGGGMATSNNYAVSIDAACLSGLGYTMTPDNTGVGGRILIMCDEVTLPGVQASVGQMPGLYQGSPVINYPTGKIYTEVQLSFMCDADMAPLKFLQDWFNFIFQSNERIVLTSGTTPTTLTAGVNTNRLKYPNEYQGTLKITKTERNANTDGGSSSVEYQLMKAWPYAIDAIPLSYGSSQLIKVTANFYYRFYTFTKYNNAKNRSGGGGTVTN